VRGGGRAEEGAAAPPVARGREHFQAQAAAGFGQAAAGCYFSLCRRESLFNLAYFFSKLLKHNICQVNFGKLLEMHLLYSIRSKLSQLVEFTLSKFIEKNQYL